MLIALASAKGSPGVTSTALTLAAVWPRPVVLVEADLDGADLAYRCASAHGGVLDSQRGLLRLAAEVRGGTAAGGRDLLASSDVLANGVHLMQGVQSAAQSRGLSTLWPILAEVFSAAASADVLVDMGRVNRDSVHMTLAVHADVFVPVASCSVESVMHLRHGLEDLGGPLNHQRPAVVVPILVGPDSYVRADCADVDIVLAEAGIPARSAHPMPMDTRALQRLEQGEATGRWSRTLLARAGKSVVDELNGVEVNA